MSIRLFIQISTMLKITFQNILAQQAFYATKLSSSQPKTILVAHLPAQPSPNALTNPTRPPQATTCAPPPPPITRTTHLHGELRLCLCVVGDALEQVAADPGDDALLVAVRLPHHRVRLTGSRLTVGEDADVVTWWGGKE